MTGVQSTTFVKFRSRAQEDLGFRGAGPGGTDTS